MDFTFSKNKTMFYGVIKNFIEVPNGKSKFELIDEFNPLDNLITIDNTDYYFTYLNSNGKNKGGNSIILKLFDSQNIDVGDLEYEDPDLILKILKYQKSDNPLFTNKSEKRFLKEIEALRKCNAANFQNVIKIFHDGTCKLYHPKKESYESYLFYTMEYAKCDLKEYVEEKHSTISMEEKVGLCISLAKGIDELYSNGFYHRDIKPDNIFMIGDSWKIGDLGLVAERNEDSIIDSIGEFIGPKGWISPEVMNKHLCENKGFQNSFDCSIDHQSDIFQLGKIFWYIFQHNAPIGAIKINDFKIKNNRIYPILKTMLNHSKTKRYNKINQVIKLLKPVEVELLKHAI